MSLAHRVLSAFLAFVFASSTVVGNASFAFAAEDSDPPPAVSALPDTGATSTSATATVTTTTPAAAPKAAETSPTVAREIEASRTADSKTYLMSDGSYRLDLCAQPVHYKDESGQWEDIDPTLVQTPEYGVSEVKASDYDIQIASDDVTETPMSVSHDGWTFGMDLVGGEQSQMMAIGDQAFYPLAMTDTSLVYETGGNAVKDTLVLASKNAPDTFTFHMKLDGLSLHQSVSGPGFVLLDAKGKRAGRIDPLTVFDSALDAAGQPRAVCTSASVSVAPAADGVNVTYHVPREWMDDPARVYPVKVDPQVTFSNTDDTSDTMYTSAYPTTSYTTGTTLDVGKFASNDYRRALLSFNIDEVADDMPQGIQIDSAALQMYCYSNTSGGSTTMNLYGVDNNWHGGSYYTWNSCFGTGSQSNAPWTGDYKGGYLRWNSLGDVVWSSWSGYNKYVYWYPTAIVQSWFNGSRSAGYGFLLMANGESGAPAKRLWSANYTTYTSRQPHLIVNYTKPTKTGTLSGTSFKPGDTVTASVKVNTKNVAPNSTTAALIMGKDTNNADVYRGNFVWDEELGFYANPAYGDASQVILNPEACWVDNDATGRTVHFVYQIGAGYGDVQNNRLYGYADGWNTTNSYTDTGVSYSITPGTFSVPASVTTTASAWFTETQANQGIEDTGTAGRGSAGLKWNQPGSATSYKVYLYDGVTYRQVGSTTATSWASAGKGLFPTDTAISNLATGTGANPFLSGTGLDLRDDPRALYQKKTGSTEDLDPNYYFKITGVNRAGEAPLSQCATIPVALENRTARLNDDVRYPAYDLGSMFGDGAAVRLDNGSFTLDAVDLKLPGNGPTAGLGRHYDSGVTASTSFAPGWRFDFEERIDRSGDVATHTDADGDEHTYRWDGSKWVAPNGCFDKLTESGGEWILSHKDLSKTKFDLTTGKLKALVDNRGKQVTYEWSGNDITIIAPGDEGAFFERRIVVHRDGSGRVTQSTLSARHSVWATGDVTQTVNYTYEGNEARVTVMPDQAEEQVTEYRYSNGRITAVAVPGFEPSANGEAVWAIDYDGDTSLTVANETGEGTPRLERVVTWDAGDRTATATSAGVPQTFSWNPNGTVLSNSNEGSAAALWTHGYDVAMNEVRSATPSGTATSANYDGRGNATYAFDEAGRMTVTCYNSQNLAVEQTDPAGSTTWSVYDPDTGNLLNQETLLDTDGKKARSEWEYDDQDRLEYERVKIDEATWAVTKYSEYHDCGSPKKVEQLGVKLSSTGASETITNTRDYDQLGNVRFESDALGNSSTAVYDGLGRVTTSADPTGTVTSYLYDTLGGVKETKRTNSSTSTVVDWKTTTYNGAGLPVTEVVKSSLGSSVTTGTHRYDMAGRETTVTDDSVPGAEVTEYDAEGQEVAHWDAGTDTSSTACAERTTYNADGEVIAEMDPGAVSMADTSTLNPDGTIASESGDDGTVTNYTYDAAGNVTSESEMSDVGTSTVTYDTNLVGDSTNEVDANGISHTTEYNLVGDEVSTGAGAQNPSTNQNNTLGWALRQTDFDEIVTENVYDKLGRVLTSTRSAAGATPMVTTNVYDEAGRVLSTTNPDGSGVAMEYDCFGRILVERHFDTSSTEAKRIRTVYDEAGRAHRTTDEITGATSESTYGDFGTETIRTTRRGGSAVTTSVVDGTGLLTSQSSVFGGVDLDWAVVATDTAGRVIDATSTVLSTDWNVRYDEAGRVVYNGGNTADPQGETSVYKPSGRLYICSVPVRGVVASGTLTYEYDKATGKKSKDNLAFGPFGTEYNTYDYDIVGNVATATVAARTHTYTYDKTSGAPLTSHRIFGEGTYADSEIADVSMVYAPGTGRITSKTQVTRGGASTIRNYGFDAWGHRLSERVSNDTSDTAYTWTGNRLTTFDGPSGHGVYTYGSDGQRTRSVVTASQVTTTTNYDYQGDALLGLTASASNGTTYTLDYMYDEKGIVFAGVYSGTDATEGVRFMMSTTDRQDVRDLIDEDGDAFAHYTYDAWGNQLGIQTAATSLVTAEQAEAIANRQPLRYASYVFDAESSLYYLSQRYYDASTMQFISKDPAKADGEMSAYMYCNDDPVNMSDPSGLWGWGSIWSGFKKVVKSVVRHVYHAVKRVVRAVVHHVRKAYRAVKRAVKRVVHKVKRAVHHFVRAVKRTYHRVKNYVTRKAKKASAKVKKAAGKAKKVVEREARALPGRAQAAGAAALDAAIKGVEDYQGMEETGERLSAGERWGQAGKGALIMFAGVGIAYTGVGSMVGAGLETAATGGMGIAVGGVMVGVGLTLLGSGYGAVEYGQRHVTEAITGRKCRYGYEINIQRAARKGLRGGK